MTEVDIVKKVCEIMGVNYSHYDNHEMGLDYFRFLRLTSKPKIVVYSSEYGHYEFVILEDMSIVTDMTSSIKTLRTMYDKMIKFGGFDDRQKQHTEFLINEENKITNAEKFLKENDCASIINDTTKKINWV